MHTPGSFKAFVGALSLMVVSAFVTSAVVPSSAFAESSAIVVKAKLSKKAALKKALKKKGFLKALPSASKAVKAKKKAKKKSLGLGVLAVSGTPPVLSSIPSRGISDLFWRDGVVSAISGGSPSQNQCGEFYAGSADGESGGLGACHMAESVGYSFQNMMQSEASRCYMQRFPTAANVAAGGVSVVSGELPAGGISAVFSPGSASRLVKITITGAPGGGGGEGEEEDGGPGTIFIRIPSISQNAAAGKLFEAGLTFCEEGGSNGGETLSLFNNGRFVAESSEARSESESSAFSVSGYLIASDGGIVWDETKTRVSTMEGTQGDSGSFKGRIEITPSNLVKVKSYDNFGGSGRKAYTVSKFSGSSLSSLRFLSGAFKELHGDGDSEFSGATEYRSSYYAAAPSSSLLDDLNVVNFSADEFYSAMASPDVDSSGDCSATPDIELSLDMNNATVQASVAPCEQNQLRDMHFCHDDSAVRAADMAYGGSCHGGGGGEGPA